MCVGGINANWIESIDDLQVLIYMIVVVDRMLSSVLAHQEMVK